MGLLTWFRDREASDQPGWFVRLVMPRGHRPDPKLEEIKRAAAEDVADMEAEDREYFRPYGPGDIEDDL
jgi:hypothetical protein